MFYYKSKIIEGTLTLEGIVSGKVQRNALMRSSEQKDLNTKKNHEFF